MTGKQLRILGGMAAALLVTIVVLIGPGQGDPHQAATVAMRALIAPALSVAAGVAFIARKRFTDPALIDGDGNSPSIALANRYLSNTVEQAVLASAAWLSFAAAAPAQAVATLPLLAATFLLGRAAFAIGYAIAPWARAFGFALTFYPSVGVLLLTIAAMLR